MTESTAFGIGPPSSFVSRGGAIPNSFFNVGASYSLQPAPSWMTGIKPKEQNEKLEESIVQEMTAPEVKEQLKMYKLTNLAEANNLRLAKGIVTGGGPKPLTRPKKKVGGGSGKTKLKIVPKKHKKNVVGKKLKIGGGGINKRKFIANKKSGNRKTVAKKQPRKGGGGSNGKAIKKVKKGKSGSAGAKVVKRRKPTRVVIINEPNESSYVKHQQQQHQQQHFQPSGGGVGGNAAGGSSEGYLF